MDLLKKAVANADGDPTNESKAGGVTSTTSADSGSTDPAPAGVTNQPSEDEVKSLIGEIFAGTELDPAADEVKKPIAAFKHKQVRLFQVGDFTFYEHVLYIYSLDELKRFSELYKGLSGPDRTNIVAYDFEAAASIESDASTAIRGMLSSSNLKDPKAIK